MDGVNPSADDVIRIARQFLFVREIVGQQNRGLRVEAIQHWSGGTFGDSWCCEFATMVLDIAFHGNAPLDRTGSCEAVYASAKKKGLITGRASVGDLFLYVNAADHAHHIGFVTGRDPLTGIAGNTSRDGTSSNGDGVYEHAISAQVFIHYLMP